MTSSLRLRAAIVSIALFLAFIGIWHIATRGTGAVATMTPEYARLIGRDRHARQVGHAGPGSTSAPGLLRAPEAAVLRRRADRQGPRHPARLFSIARVGRGYLLAVAFAIPLGFLVGMSPLMSQARSIRSSRC